MLPAMPADRIVSDPKRARRDLIQRIEAFIQSLEKCQRDPTSWECEHALRALRALEECDFARGERVIMWAEWPAMRHPSPVVAAKLQPQYIPTNTAGLRARFKQVVGKIV